MNFEELRFITFELIVVLNFLDYFRLERILLLEQDWFILFFLGKVSFFRHIRFVWYLNRNDLFEIALNFLFKNLTCLEEGVPLELFPIRP